MNFWAWFVGAFIVLGLGMVGWQYLQPATEVATPGHSMEPPDTSSIDTGDPIVAVNLPERLSTNAQIGKNVFEAKCAVCHGVNAAGQNGVAPPLVHQIYEPNHHSDGSFVYAAANGVQAHHWDFGNMPPIEGLTRADVQMVATYVRELQRANGIN